MVKGKCFMKKKILIAILVIIVIAIAIFAYFMISDLQQEQKLKDELTELNSLSNAETIDVDAINERLNRTITKGDYAVVEQAFKQYQNSWQIQGENITFDRQELFDEYEQLISELPG